MTIDAGYEHSIAVRADGSVLTWGNDQEGQLGDDNFNGVRPAPVAASGLGAGSGVVAVAAGFAHSLAATTVVEQGFTPLAPARAWDSRFGPGPLGRVGPGQLWDVAVAGVGGVPVTGVAAVVLNVTVVNPTGGTFVTVWPTGEAKPLASNLNAPPGDTRANLVTVKVGATGQVRFANDAGEVDLIADVAGWYGTGGSQRYTAVSPARANDSRFGPGLIGRIGPGQTRQVLWGGISGIPHSASAVVLNVTAVNPSAATYLTAWPTGEARPLASNLNLPPGDTRPNLVVVKAPPDVHGGTPGQTSFYNDAGSVDLVVDVAGYYSGTGAGFTSLSPTRVWDSRFGPGPQGRIETGGTRELTVTGGVVPATGVAAVVLNVTAAGPTAGTYVTVWPTGETKPLASNLNIQAGDTRATLVIVKVGTGGKVTLSNDAGTVDLIADVAGWFGLPPAEPPGEG